MNALDLTISNLKFRWLDAQIELFKHWKLCRTCFPIGGKDPQAPDCPEGQKLKDGYEDADARYKAILAVSE